MDYFAHLKQRLDDEEKFVPALLGSKKLVGEFARMLGVATPSTYYQGPLSDLSLSSLPQEFVLKPAFASTSIGVLLLQRVGVSHYKNIVTGKDMTETDVRTICSEVSLRFLQDAGKGDFIVEELLRDSEGATPPADIRFYSFQGDIGLILKEEHLTQGPTKAMYFDENFLPFPDVAQRYAVAEKMRDAEHIVDAVVPRNWKELLAVARRISVAVPSAFVRVDLYDTVNGIMLGELTFYPGTFYYRNRKMMSHSESERLGRLWDLAEERLSGSQNLVSLREPFN